MLTACPRHDLQERGGKSVLFADPKQIDDEQKQKLVRCFTCALAVDRLKIKSATSA